MWIIIVNPYFTWLATLANLLGHSAEVSSIVLVCHTSKFIGPLSCGSRKLFGSLVLVCHTSKSIGHPAEFKEILRSLVCVYSTELDLNYTNDSCVTTLTILQL